MIVVLLQRVLRSQIQDYLLPLLQSIDISLEHWREWHIYSHRQKYLLLLLIRHWGVHQTILQHRHMYENVVI